jgi:hypothetical protein
MSGVIFINKLKRLKLKKNPDGGVRVREARGGELGGP